VLKEINHFIRTGIELSRRQTEQPRAEFADWMMARADDQGYADVRRELVGDLTGRVLEIGCGTGTMFRYYGDRARVEAIEPEGDFLALALTKARSSSGTIHAAEGNGAELAFEAGSFDAVVLGLVLCSVSSVERVVSEAFRVLRGGGRLRTLDHVRSDGAISGLLMAMTNPLWLRLNNQGCSWNRNPIRAIADAGFRIDDVMAFKRFDTVMPAFPMRRVKAHKPRAPSESDGA
jgi:SAM-dependent methyltransferase